MTQFEEPDEYCPHCDNHYVIEAVTPETIQEEKTARAKALRLKREQAKQAALMEQATKESSEDATKETSEDTVPPLQLQPQ